MNENELSHAIIGAAIEVHREIGPGIMEKVIVDLKAKEQVTPVDKLKVLTYLRLLDLRLGMLINFHVAVLKDGLYRVVNNLRLPDLPPEPPDLRS